MTRVTELKRNARKQMGSKASGIRKEAAGGGGHEEIQRL